MNFNRKFFFFLLTMAMGQTILYLQSFSKPAGTPVVLNHNSIDTSFFKQYASPPPNQCWFPNSNRITHQI